VAAPYVKQVLEKTLTYLNVSPDKGAEASTAARGERTALTADAAGRH